MLKNSPFTNIVGLLALMVMPHGGQGLAFYSPSNFTTLLTLLIVKNVRIFPTLYISILIGAIYYTLNYGVFFGARYFYIFLSIFAMYNFFTKISPHSAKVIIKAFLFILMLNYAYALITSNGFYEFKKNTVLYYDTNFLAYFLLSCLIGMACQKVEQIKKYRLISYMFIIMLLLSLSRMSWILWVLYKAKRIIGFLFWPAIIFSSIIVTIYLQKLIDFDPSFSSKALIVATSLKIIPTLSLEELIFGLGRSESFIRFKAAGSHFGGHNILGVGLEFGSLYIFTILTAFYRAIGRQGLLLFVLILLGSVVSLFPATYLGQIVAGFYLTRKLH